MTSARNTKKLICYCSLTLFGFVLLRWTHFAQLSSLQSVLLEFPRIDEIQDKKKRESYSNQDKTVAIHGRFDEVLPHVTSVNSDPLPPRLFDGTPDQYCQKERAHCVPPYATFEPLIVTAPEYRMMSCINQKSLSTVMNAVFCYLIRREEFVKSNRSLLREYADIKLCQAVNEFPSIDAARHRLHVHMNDFDKWKLTMVTRDPIDRVLSGFIDRCIRTGDDCSGCRTNMTCFLEKEHKRMFNYAWADGYHLPRPWMTMEDLHTFPQNWRCQLDRYYDHYEFLRYSNDPSKTLLKDLVRIMKEQQVPDDAVNYIEKELTSGRTAHSTSDTKVRVFLENRLRSSPYLMELVIRMFYWDYKLLKYEFPQL